MANKIPLSFEPPDYDDADVYAIQACIRGDATAEQQQRAITWVVYKAAAVDEVDYRPDEREHVFVSGRRFVGLQVKKLIALDMGRIIRARERKIHKEIE